MGIRTACPNGHKLHLKVFLAGKRGICPKCGAKFVIPLSDGTVPASPTRRVERRPIGAGGVFDQPIDKLLEGDRHDAEPPIEIGTEPGLGHDSDLEATQPIGPPAADLAPNAPTRIAPDSAAGVLGEQPDAVWYVQLASGERFGPALGSMMAGWLEQGRIPGDALVWRQGWPDWRLAKAAFSGKIAGTRPTAWSDESGGAQLVAPVASSPVASKSAGAARSRARTRWERGMNSVLALFVVVVLLAAVLTYVLLR